MDHLLGFSGMQSSRARTSGPQPSYTSFISSRVEFSTQGASLGRFAEPMGMSYLAEKATTLTCGTQMSMGGERMRRQRAHYRRIADGEQDEVLRDGGELRT